jgi:hypothetical protein
VLSALRREHELRLDHVCPALDYVRERLGVERPLARQEFLTDGVDLFVRKLGEPINATRQGQGAIRRWSRRTCTGWSATSAAS